MKKLYLLAITLFTCVSIHAQTDSTISTLVNFHQGNGSGLGTRTVVDTFFFPHDLAAYDTINMHVMLNCPTGGCDIWDRFASISLYHEGEWYEIGRYVTPYGKSCGWSIDVSDYRNMLTDTVILKSFIDTWTNPGWLVNIDFEMKAGTPSHPYIRVENLWTDYNVVYGDTTQPVNIDMQTRFIDAASTGVKVKIVNTGHGQGNLNNAAEFSQKTHHLVINGSQTFNQLLWRSNCGSNPCSPQNGTWTNNRAGWCPGADVIPYEYDIMPYVTPGQATTIDYQLQSYFNTCSPNNPGCVAGGNCPDCQYNYIGHTEPHYKITGQLITYLSTPNGINKTEEDNFSIRPNPSSGIFTINTSNHNNNYSAQLYSSIGRLVWTGNVRNGQQLDFDFLPIGIYTLKLMTGKFSLAKKLIIE